MRTFLITLLVSIFVFSSAFAVGGKRCDRTYNFYNSHGCFLDDVDIDIEDGTIILTHAGRDRGEVEITEDYELYVNGRFIATNEEQQELLCDYYELTMDIVDRAKEIGLEGAKIGANGAAIGLKAVGGVFRALLTEYEFEDLEYDIEREAEELEEMAEELEREAEVLEDMADELAEVHEDLRRETPELRELRWF